MTLERARVIRANALAPDAFTKTESTDHARRVPREVAEAHAEAARILAEAREKAASTIEHAAETAARDAREQEIARLAASFLALRDADAQRAERDADRLIELAVLLAERLIGEMLRLDPTRIAELAATALQETRGSRRVRIDASPDDADALREALRAASRTADVHADAELARGSLVVHTDIGRIDARLETQLVRLAAALREVLR